MKRDLVLSSSEIDRKREEERRAEETKSKKGEDESLPREISRHKTPGGSQNPLLYKLNMEKAKPNNLIMGV